MPGRTGHTLLTNETYKPVSKIVNVACQEQSKKVLRGKLGVPCGATVSKVRSASPASLLNYHGSHNNSMDVVVNNP